MFIGHLGEHLNVNGFQGPHFHPSGFQGNYPDNNRSNIAVHLSQTHQDEQKTPML